MYSVKLRIPFLPAFRMTMKDMKNIQTIMNNVTDLNATISIPKIVILVSFRISNLQMQSYVIKTGIYLRMKRLGLVKTEKTILAVYYW